MEFTLKNLVEQIKYCVRFSRDFYEKGLRGYCLYVCIEALKYFSDFIVSYSLGKVVCSFDYLGILRLCGFIDEDEKLYLDKVLHYLRRLDRLERVGEVDFGKIFDLVDRVVEVIEDEKRLKFLSQRVIEVLDHCSGFK